MSQPVVLNTPSGATVELSYFRSAGRYCATLKVNNTVITRAFGTHTATLDGDDLILNDAHFRLLPESLPVVSDFFRETYLSFVTGGKQ